MAQKFSDAARAELVATINSTDLSFTIAAGGSLFPVADTGASAIGNAADWFKIVLQDVDGIEIVYVRTHVADSLSFSNILRGQEGTTAKAFLAGSIVGLRPLASDAANVVRLGDARDTAITLALATDPSWLQLADMPAVIAAGADEATARTAIGLGSVDNTSDASKPVSTAQQTALNLKVDTVAGKGLSTEDYSTAEKTKLAAVSSGATANATDADLRDRSTHTGAQAISTVTGLQTALDAKQASLVSATNIKTINSTSILGAGDIEILGGPTVNDTAPTTPSNGQEWVDGVTGIKFTWLEDGTGGQWVELGPGGAKSAWADITGKPAVIAAGVDAATARAAIGAAAQGETISLVRQPINATPAASATGVMDGVTLSASPYYSLYSTPMAAAQWQVSTSSTFATTLVSTGDVAGTVVTYAIATGLMSVNTAYYWRVRYKDTAGAYSDWSAATSFTTAANFNVYIATPAPTPTNFGDPFEGGFYMGLFWNQITQSTSSKTLATGTQTFTVPNMATTPIVYAGQTLEVRSRANPTNKFIGTVTGAIGTTLTLNVSSIGGSGTFSDWSVMSLFRHIEAPKASGEHAGIALKNAGTAFPVACQTLTEGWEATIAMVAAGDATTYPAAHWARNLVIGGKNDWHIPARDVRELSWRNGKPTTTANYVTADRPTASTFNYMNNGSYGDTANTHGLNNNSVPAGASYTSSVPAQTAATAFRTGGAEAFEFGSAYYWSSSDYDASSAWSQSWNSSVPGNQRSVGKANAGRVRAARRSII